jgi:hypothetical protein
MIETRPRNCSANGAVFIVSLGQRPRNAKPNRNKALKARFNESHLWRSPVRDPTNLGRVPQALNEGRAVGAEVND